jgi:hypothetical protein
MTVSPAFAKTAGIAWNATLRNLYKSFIIIEQSNGIAKTFTR